MRFQRLAAVAATALLATTAACSNQASAGGDGSNYPSGSVTLTVPSDPGSGFDLALRTVAEVAEKEGVVETPLTVQNRPGGLTTTFEKTLVNQYKGADDQLSIASLSTILLDVEDRSDYTLDDVTLIAGLMQEDFSIVADNDSKYQDLDAVFKALKEDPDSVKVGSQLEDTLAFALLAEEAGVDASEVTFVKYEGGGEQATAVMNGDVDIAVAGTSEFLGLLKSGELKGLGVIGSTPVPGVDIPTTKKLGYETEFSNWRAIIGPPDMPDYAVEYWQDAIKEITSSPSWKEAAKKNNWTTIYMKGDELEKRADSTKEQIEAAEEKLGRKIIK